MSCICYMHQTDGMAPALHFLSGNTVSKKSAGGPWPPQCSSPQACAVTLDPVLEVRRRGTEELHTLSSAEAPARHYTQRDNKQPSVLRRGSVIWTFLLFGWNPRWHLTDWSLRVPRKKQLKLQHRPVNVHAQREGRALTLSSPAETLRWKRPSWWAAAIKGLKSSSAVREQTTITVDQPTVSGTFSCHLLFRSAHLPLHWTDVISVESLFSTWSANHSTPKHTTDHNDN